VEVIVDSVWHGKLLPAVGGWFNDAAL